MKSVNKVILVGNLGKDPEVVSFPTGKCLINVTLATSDRFKKDDEWQDRTEWHNVVIWCKAADNISQYLHKGSRVYLEGRIQTRSWDDKTSGEKKYRTEVVSDEHTIVFLDKKGEDKTEPREKPLAAPIEPNPYSPITDDDIPF